MQKTFMQNLIRLVVGLLGLLVITGASAIILRDTYPKDVVDAKDEAVKAAMEQRIDYHKNLQDMETRHIRSQLDLIRSDQKEIKDMIKEKLDD